MNSSTAHTEGSTDNVHSPDRESSEPVVPDVPAALQELEKTFLSKTAQKILSYVSVIVILIITLIIQIVGWYKKAYQDNIISPEEILQLIQQSTQTVLSTTKTPTTTP